MPSALLLFAFVPVLLRHGGASRDARHHRLRTRCCRRCCSRAAAAGSARSRWPRCSPPKSTPATPSCSCSRPRRRRTSTSASSTRRPPTRSCCASARSAAVAGGSRRRAAVDLLQTVIGALTIFYSLLVVTLFVPILGGLYVAARRLGREALAAIAAGVADAVRRTVRGCRHAIRGSIRAGWHHRGRGGRLRRAGSSAGVARLHR